MPVIGGQEEAEPLRWGCSRLCGDLSPPGACCPHRMAFRIETHAMERRDTPTSTALGERVVAGRVPQLHIVVKKAMSVLRSQAWLVLLLVLFCCGWRQLVLDPETFHKEVDDGPVQMLLERHAVEVVAFVRVYLSREKSEVTPRQFPC